MQLMSIEDLATYLGDSKRTIYKYIASGDCPPYIKISAKNIKFDRADVDSWLESKKVIPQTAQDNVQAGTLPWTPRTKQVMNAARKVASKYKSESVATEQILLGILEVKNCLGARILNNIGINQKKVIELCENFSENKKDDSTSKTSGKKAALSENAQKAVSCAHEQARNWGHEYIGAEHLLAGILLVDECLGKRLLNELGVTLERVCKETANLIVLSPASDEKTES